MERRVRFVAGRARASRRDDQGDRADRDAARGVRDGRDPVRAARALGRAQRRPLGLHLLLDQVLPGPARDGPARPRRRDDDGAVHARLHRAAGRDVPQARGARDGRHVRADPEPQGRPGGEREGARRACARTRSARSPRATTGPGSRIPTSSRSRARCSSRGWTARPTSSSAGATTSTSSAAELLDLAATPGAITEKGLRTDVNVGLPVHLVLADRPRRRRRSTR